MPNYHLSHLDQLEAEAIFVLRETAAQFQNPGPALLRRQGLDRHGLARPQGLLAGPMPFPLVHVDTGHNFPETMTYRDEFVDLCAPSSSSGWSRSPSTAAAWSRKRAPTPRATNSRPSPCSTPSRNTNTTPASAAAAATRKSPRQGALLLPPRRLRPVGSQKPAPRTLEPLQRPQAPRRTLPRLPALQLHRDGHLDVHPARKHPAALHLLRPPARGLRTQRPAPRRHRLPQTPGPDEKAETRNASASAPSAMPPAPAPSSPAASNLDEVIAEVAAARQTERGTRADDKRSETAMEDRKKRGLFLRKMDLRPPPLHHRRLRR
jgi:sulfate adenylyltransferase subunit 2